MTSYGQSILLGGSTMNIIEELQWRDAINQQTDAEGLAELVNQTSISLYCGVDPTGDSIHVGHLIPFIILKRFQMAGHKPVILIGGGTGSIGDPSGRQSERQLQTKETVQHNVEKLSQQMKSLFKAGDDESGICLVNNAEWLTGLSVLDFLRIYGKEFNVNTMLAKDVVASRLDQGISFAEFSYQIIQSIDFLHLFQQEAVQLQIGGSDQWGNITAGLDLIRKKEGHEARAYGLTIPLLLKADGTKFGKSADGAVWLDPDKTSPYEFYQFWINQKDADVIRYLKYFTFLDREEIEELQVQLEEAPHLRQAQKALASEMTRFVHGEQALQEAVNITEALFSGDISMLTAQQIDQTFNDVPTFTLSKDTMSTLVELLADMTTICSSRREARELMANGAITVNGQVVTDLEVTTDTIKCFDDRFMIIRRGKKKYYRIDFQ